MHNTLFRPVNNCIKNVYNLRTQTGKTSEQLHTPSTLTHQFTQPMVHNSRVTPLFVLVLATQLSTSKMNELHLLYRRLYPQSTPPINKKKKEK